MVSLRETTDRVRRLCDVLLDRSLSVSVRDDAAIDLGIDGDGTAVEALADVATDAAEHTSIAASAGEALANIWLRLSSFDPELFARLTIDARHEAAALIEMHHPEWLQQVVPFKGAAPAGVTATNGRA
jgi:hypothetical protein